MRVVEPGSRQALLNNSTNNTGDSGVAVEVQSKQGKEGKKVNQSQSRAIEGFQM
jgi:hypothetical protein